MANDTESVLVDTSVWVDALRGRTSTVVTTTQELLSNDRVLTCGPVICEIKRGLRQPERNKIVPLFDALIRLAFDDAVWDSAGDLDAALRKNGITIPPMDVIIAQICIRHNVFLYTVDEHFRSIPGLKLFAP